MAQAGQSPKRGLRHRVGDAPIASSLQVPLRLPIGISSMLLSSRANALDRHPARCLLQRVGRARPRRTKNHLEKIIFRLRIVSCLYDNSLSCGKPHPFLRIAAVAPVECMPIAIPMAREIQKISNAAQQRVAQVAPQQSRERRPCAFVAHGLSPFVPDEPSASAGHGDRC